MLLFLLAVLIVAAVVLFYALDRYVVVTDDGVSLEFPPKGEASASVSDGGAGADIPVPDISAEIVVVEPDFDEIQTDAGEGLTPVKALFVPRADITAEKLPAYTEKLAASGANALVLELKAADGLLMWKSDVETAYAYGTSGILDITSFVTAWKEAGVYLVAQISCCTDELMAARNPNLALKNADGTVYKNDAGSWLDPYNRSVREYIVDLARELAGYGFDEILFSDLSHPVAEGLVYSQAMTAAPDPVAAVDGFAMRLYNAFADTETRVSVLCGTASARNAASAQTGEDLGFFFRVFDRVYCATDAYNIETDRGTVTAFMTTGEAASRFVPVASYTPSLDSWVVVTAGSGE